MPFHDLAQPVDPLKLAFGQRLEPLPDLIGQENLEEGGQAGWARSGRSSR
jgi:hypothetical protein